MRDAPGVRIDACSLRWSTYTCPANIRACPNFRTSSHIRACRDGCTCRNNCTH